MSNTFSLSDFIIYSIPIGLKISLKSIQYILGSLGTAARLIIKKHGFINRVVVHPIISLMSASFFIFIEHFNLCFIRLEISFTFILVYLLFVMNIYNLYTLSFLLFIA